VHIGIEKGMTSLLDVWLAGAAWWGIVALILAACRQPARRSIVARVGVLGSFFLFPLVGLEVGPRFELGSWVWEAAPPSWKGNPWTTEVPILGERSVVLRNIGAGMVLGLYLGGLAYHLGWLTLGCWGMLRLERGSSKPSAFARSLYQGLSFPSSRRRPRLLVSSRLRGPALVGVFRPTILIPTVLDRPGARDLLRLAMLHELAHAARHDPLFGFLGSVARAFWFVLPPLWWIHARMRLDQEFLADQHASNRYGSRDSYVSALVEPFQPWPVPERGGPIRHRPDGWFRGSALFQRVLVLLRCPFPIEERPPGWFKAGIGALAPLLLLGVSTLSLRGLGPVRPTPQPPSLQSFRLDHVRMAAQSRPAPVPLPLKLPKAFELRADVWVEDRLDVSGVRIAGCPLAPPRSPADAGWRQLHLRHHEGTTLVWWDGDPDSVFRSRQAPSPWLTLRAAPNQPLIVRNLLLSWPICRTDPRWARERDTDLPRQLQ
jgi:hypothetical protein